MRRIGKFEVISEAYNYEVDLKQLNIGVNDLKHHFIKLNSNRHIEYVIDKTCDHAGGRLILKKDKAVCPMHGWHLDMERLIYNDSHICKQPSDFKFIDQEKIVLEDTLQHLKNPFFKADKKGKVSMRWLNHAAILIECNGVSLVTDPWLFGPAFMTGWWLDEPSTEDAVSLIKAADYIYLSHNHPDHLHPETLSLIAKDKPIIVADFHTKSTEKYIRALGFKNIIALGFNEIHEIGRGFQISVLKSGDFRDDSGLYVNANNNQILLTVDCNFLNAHTLPKGIDLLLTSFASGATGFPLCYKNYSPEDKRKIQLRNIRSTKAKVVNYIKATEPKYYLPYAGMFKEYSKRDAYIKEHNEKNRVQDYKSIAESMGVEFVLPNKLYYLRFDEGKLTHQPIDVQLMKVDDTDYYIETYKKEYIYSGEKIIDYLKASNYFGDQIVQIIPTDDSYNSIVNDIVYADFKQQMFEVIPEEEIVDQLDGLRVMKLYIRAEIMACVVENKLPWEDFSIGFQMRVERYPNTYESDLWYHFTNVYINSEHFRYSAYCGACTKIEQNPIWNVSRQLKKQNDNV
jgi:CMP-N-acetylneuraminate monooxygenase